MQYLSPFLRYSLSIYARPLLWPWSLVVVKVNCRYANWKPIHNLLIAIIIFFLYSPTTSYFSSKYAWLWPRSQQRTYARYKYANWLHRYDFHFDKNINTLQAVTISNIFAIGLCMIWPLSCTMVKCKHVNTRPIPDIILSDSSYVCPVCHHLQDIRRWTIYIYIYICIYIYIYMYIYNIFDFKNESRSNVNGPVETRIHAFQFEGSSNVCTIYRHFKHFLSTYFCDSDLDRENLSRSNWIYQSEVHTWLCKLMEIVMFSTRHHFR